MLNKLTGLLASAILVTGLATAAFAQGNAPAAPRPQNPSPMQGQAMMNGHGMINGGEGMMNGQGMRNGEGTMGGSGMMGMMHMMTQMNRMMGNCNHMMESAMRSPPAQPQRG